MSKLASPLVGCSDNPAIGGAMAAVLESRAFDPEWPASTLLAAVTHGFSIAREPRLVRQRFEEELRTLVNARSVAVRQCAYGAPTPDVISVEVPAPPWSAPTRLEAVFEPAQPVDDWKRRTLSVGAQVAALLVELEHADGRWVRFRRTDGAAPLIGSSAPIPRACGGSTRSFSSWRRRSSRWSRRSPGEMARRSTSTAAASSRSFRSSMANNCGHMKRCSDESCRRCSRVCTDARRHGR